MAGSLEGINVLDLTHALSGPFCSMLLAELGANIIKIEPPSGDHFRPANNGATFAVVNRNKRSICIDLKNQESAKVMNSLISRSDIMLENFTPGTARRLGYDYERVKKIKTDIIYASISGFGQSGPYRDLKGYDAVAQAMSGIMASTGEPDRPPVRVGPSMIDMGTGMYVVIGIMDALRKKDIEGQGRYLEFNLLESALSWMSQSIANYSKTGVVPPRTGSALGSFSPYQVFNAKDDQIFIGASTELFWQKLCEALSTQELLTDQRFIDMKSRVTNRNVLTKIIENTLSHMTVDAILQKLRKAGIPCAPVLTVEGVVNDPHVKNRNSLTHSEDSTIGNILQTKMPIGDGTPPRAAPKLGEHNSEILAEYGFSKQEIQHLKDSKTIIG
jgi:crotonobetainyl-CoA:carnitine CoA-transferase CaiB-like acyl-CoA transferase